MDQLTSLKGVDAKFTVIKC